MNLEWLYLTGPWAVALWAALVALLLLACLRALRRRREVVPGLAIFARVRAQNLPPAPPPRWLDRVFVFKALLLGALTAICAGLALASARTAPRRVAFLIDDGPAGQYSVVAQTAGNDRESVESGTLADKLKAAAQAVRQEPSLAAADLETVTLSSLTARGEKPLSVEQALQLLQTRAGVETVGWEAIHVFTPFAPPADLAARLGGLRVVWHQPAASVQPNLGIVRLRVEPAPPAAAVGTAGAEGAVGGSDWQVWVETNQQKNAGQIGILGPTIRVECIPQGGSPSAKAVFRDHPAPGVIGPLTVHLPAGTERLRVTAGWPELMMAPATKPPNWKPFQDSLPADDRVILRWQPGAATVAQLFGAADTPMVRAAMAAWNITVVETDAAPVAKAETLGAVLLISDGGPQAAAALAALHRAGRAVLPIYLNPTLDVDGLQLPSGEVQPQPADRTFVPAGRQTTYGVLGRASWQIAAVRPALLLFGGTVVVDSPAGPALVRWVDPTGRPAWGLLFDPAQSSLAGRDAGAWLAFWQVARGEAEALAATGTVDHCGSGWRIDRPATAAGVPDRVLSELQLPSGGRIAEFGPAPEANPPTGGTAARNSVAVTSLAALAAALALVLLCLVILAEAARAPENATV